MISLYASAIIRLSKPFPSIFTLIDFVLTKTSSIWISNPILFGHLFPANLTVVSSYNPVILTTRVPFCLRVNPILTSSCPFRRRLTFLEFITNECVSFTCRILDFQLIPTYCLILVSLNLIVTPDTFVCLSISVMLKSLMALEMFCPYLIISLFIKSDVTDNII